VSDARPRIGVSACLLGEPVRFDGHHKRDTVLVDVLGPHVRWVPVCPEMEAGFGTPREPMRLMLPGPRTRPRGRFDPADLVLVVTRTGADVTERLLSTARERVEWLAAQDLCGFVLKKDSPSCGMERVKVYVGETPERRGRGLFAEALIARLPNLPIEEEGRLSDARLRENFVERVFAYQRLRTLFGSRWTLADLVRFHTAHKLTLMAHSPAAYGSLGRLVAGAKRRPGSALATEYEAGFMQALSAIATPARHGNVLRHMLGYLRKRLDLPLRAELLRVVDDHRRGRVPLVVPLTMIRHHVRSLGIDDLRQQTYLDPHPRELSLRNHV
jgi:uncharacterized protein YbgA (DUF1722 family)/uncharacterized protein YbbK (DUF523 family)